MRGSLKAWVDNLGFYIYRWALRATRLRAFVTPLASYCPWESDSEFMRIYEQIAPNTLVDMYRCYELWQLLGQLTSLEGALLEVGVWRGGSGALIAARARSLGIREPVYLCDTFAGVVKAGSHDTRYVGGEHATSMEPARALTDRLGLDNVRFLQGIFPEETAGGVAEPRIRFCHIDVDVYQSAEDILAWVWERLEVGGVVVYDDYGFLQTPGVTRHLNEQIGKPDRRVIYNLNGHGLLIKIR